MVPVLWISYRAATRLHRSKSKNWQMILPRIADSIFEHFLLVSCNRNPFWEIVKGESLSPESRSMSGRFLAGLVMFWRPALPSLSSILLAESRFDQARSRLSLRRHRRRAKIPNPFYSIRYVRLNSFSLLHRFSPCSSGRSPHSLRMGPK